MAPAYDGMTTRAEAASAFEKSAGLEEMRLVSGMVWFLRENHGPTRG